MFGRNFKVNNRACNRFTRVHAITLRFGEHAPSSTRAHARVLARGASVSTRPLGVALSPFCYKYEKKCRSFIINSTFVSEAVC